MKSNNTLVIPFRLTFRPGIPLYEQVLYAARKAIVSGQLRPGDPFPSVRTLSRELKINPNTAHRVIYDLTSQGLVEIRPGIGTVVSTMPQATLAASAALLGNELEALVVEAKQLGMQLSDVMAALSDHWQRLGGAETAVPADSSGGQKSK
jgi:GntR family transcriptional regulator